IGVMIPQDVVNIPQRCGEILPLDPIHRAEVFPGVHVIEIERSFKSLCSALQRQRRARKATCGGQGSETEQATAADAVVGRWRWQRDRMRHRFPSLASRNGWNEGMRMLRVGLVQRWHNPHYA